MWLALVAGNSRFHWGMGDRQTLISRWDTPPLSGSDLGKIIVELCQGRLSALLNPPPSLHLSLKTKINFTVASVLPELNSVWQAHPHIRVLELADLPVQGTYPTFGIDRGLGIVGAGERWGWPILVIDGGTALTFTGADGDRHLVGGAILPGLGLQTRILAEKTGALPLITCSQSLPPRWSLNTAEAITSGILYTMLAGIHGFIQDWHRQYPDSPIIFTGGDGEILYTLICQTSPQTEFYLRLEPDAIFLGIMALQ